MKPQPQQQQQLGRAQFHHPGNYIVLYFVLVAHGNFPYDGTGYQLSSGARGILLIPSRINRKGGNFGHPTRPSSSHFFLRQFILKYPRLTETRRRLYESQPFCSPLHPQQQHCRSISRAFHLVWRGNLHLPLGVSLTLSAFVSVSLCYHIYRLQRVSTFYAGNPAFIYAAADTKGFCLFL